MKRFRMTALAACAAAPFIAGDAKADELNLQSPPYVDLEKVLQPEDCIKKIEIDVPNQDPTTPPESINRIDALLQDARIAAEVNRCLAYYGKHKGEIDAKRISEIEEIKERKKREYLEAVIVDLVTAKALQGLKINWEGDDIFSFHNGNLYIATLFKNTPEREAINPRYLLKNSVIVGWGGYTPSGLRYEVGEAELLAFLNSKKEEIRAILANINVVGTEGTEESR